MAHIKPKGSFVALVTPMNAEDSIDYEGFRTLLNWHGEIGTEAVLIMGSTGAMASSCVPQPPLNSTMAVKRSTSLCQWGAFDADGRGIRDGDTVRLWNGRGACLATARVGGDALERNGTPTVLTADRTTSNLGRACAALSALVRVAPYSHNDKKG